MGRYVKLFELNEENALVRECTVCIKCGRAIKKSINPQDDESDDAILLNSFLKVWAHKDCVVKYRQDSNN